LLPLFFNDDNELTDSLYLGPPVAFFRSLNLFDFFLVFCCCCCCFYFFKIFISSSQQINELKKLHQAGGRSTYTWMKQPQDAYTNIFGALLMTFGMWQSAVAFYRLSTGKGKLD